MKFYTLLLTVGICFFNQLCEGQECQSVQKIDAKDGVAYMGIVDLPKNTNFTDNHLFALMLAKSIIKTDTTYKLSIGMNAKGVAGTTPPKGILLQFEDGSQISKPDQLLEVMPMTTDQAMLSAEVVLTLEEIRQIKNKSLVNIILASDGVKVANGLLKEVANCLLVTW